MWREPLANGGPEDTTMPSKIEHNTSETITFPCGKVVRIYVWHNSSGWVWSIRRVDDNVNVYEKMRCTDEKAMMQTMFKEMVAEAQAEADAEARVWARVKARARAEAVKAQAVKADAECVTGYATIGMVVHLDRYNQLALNCLMACLKEDAAKYRGVTVISGKTERIGPTLLP